MPRTFHLPLAILSLLASLAARAADTAPDLAPLVKALSSPEFAQREAAQKQLAALPVSAYPALKEFTPTDPEAKIRLATVLVTFENRFALNPPPLSLKFKDLDIHQVTDTLAHATGIPFQSHGDRSPMLTYSLDVQDKPFWDIIALLGTQHDLAFSTNAPAPYLHEWYGSPPTGTPFGGFITRVEIKMLATDSEFIGHSPGARILSLSANADPRIAILGIKSVPVQHVVGADGQSLLSPETTEKAAAEDNYYPTHDWRILQRTELPATLKSGTKIASIKAEVMILIGSGPVKVEIPDIQKTSEYITVGSETIRFAKFATQSTPQTSLNFKTQLAHRFSGILRATHVDIASYEHPVFMTLVDGTGKEIYRGLVHSDANISVTGFQFPVKAIFTTTARPLEVRLPFEAKDVTVP